MVAPKLFIDLASLGSNWPANRRSASSWKDFLVGIKTRGLHGVRLVISDDHPGLRRAVIEVLPEALWRRCYDFLRNALAYLPRHKAADDCLVELRWMCERRDAAERRRELASWLAKWQVIPNRREKWIHQRGG
jgi:putative transposase